MAKIKSRFYRVLLLSLICAMAAVSAPANEIQAYQKDSLVQMQQGEKKVMLQYHASWCPICKKQKNILEKLVNDPAFSTVVFVSANYDLEKDLKKKYGVKGQSTIILFQGNTEIGRTQGLTDEKEIRNFLLTLAQAPKPKGPVRSQ